jgi:hypothetical protein
MPTDADVDRYRNSVGYAERVADWVMELAYNPARTEDRHWQVVCATYETSPTFVDDAAAWAAWHSDRFTELDAAADTPRIGACDEFEEYREGRLEEWDR